MTTALVDADGRLIAARLGAGASAFAPPATRATLAPLVDEALRDVLAGSDPGDVRGMVVGLAGATMRPEAERTIAEVAGARGIGVHPLIVNDAETIFASGTAAWDGYVLVAGTGAIALVIRDRVAKERVDGHGWLLGDHGSAVWIGFAAVRSVLGSLDGRLSATTLVDELPAALGDLAGHPCGADAREIVVTAHELPPAAIGRLAPLVDSHARHGDAIARGILRSAATGLAATLATAVGHGGEELQDLPIVLGGSVAHDNLIVRRSLQRSIRRRWPSAPLHAVRSGATGAALWARRLDGHEHDDAMLQHLRREIETSAIDVATRK